MASLQHRYVQGQYAGRTTIKYQYAAELLDPIGNRELNWGHRRPKDEMLIRLNAYRLGLPRDTNISYHRYGTHDRRAPSAIGAGSF